METKRNEYVGFKMPIATEGRLDGYYISMVEEVTSGLQEVQLTNGPCCFLS